MAIYNAGYLSPIRKKLGNAVGRKWRSLDVLAVYQPFVSNPNTSAQKRVRLRFGTLATMAMHAANAINLGFEAICKGTKIPQRSMFISKNWGAVIADSDVAVTIDYTELVFSDGSLAQVDTTGNASFADPLAVTMSYNAETSAGGEFIDKDDIVYGVVLDTETGFVYVGTGVRGVADVVVTVPASANGHRVHAYLFAVGAGVNDMGRVSPSQYMGSGLIS